MFVKKFNVHSKIEGKLEKFPDYSLLPCHAHIASSIINMPHQSGTFATIDKPTSTHHNYPEPIICLMAHSNVIYSMGLDEWIMTCIHHYGFIQSIFTP